MKPKTAPAPKQFKTHVRKVLDEVHAAKIDRMFNQKRLEMLANRLQSSKISDANRYSILGDEYRLRQELELGHNVNERDSCNGRSVMHDAIAGGHFHIVRTLINEYSADVNLPTMLGTASPLHMAVSFGFRQIASILISSGANVRAKDSKGCCPLHLVNKLSLLKLLLKYDVDPCDKNNENLTPLGYYEKYTLKADQNEEMLSIMKTKEDLRTIELARQKITDEKAAREDYLNKLALVISSNTTEVQEETKDAKNSNNKKSTLK